MEKYESFSEFAERVGVKTGTLGGYDLPEPDAMIGKTRGWRTTTIEDWDAKRPRSKSKEKPRAKND